MENNTTNEIDNLPPINTATISTDKDKSNISFIFDKKNKSNKNLNFNLISATNTSKPPTNRKNKIIISKRRDNTILFKKDQTKEYINNQKIIINSINGLFDDKLDKKVSVFKLLSKKIYKEKLIKI